MGGLVAVGGVRGGARCDPCGDSPMRRLTASAQAGERVPPFSRTYAQGGCWLNGKMAVNRVFARGVRKLGLDGQTNGFITAIKPFVYRYLIPSRLGVRW